MNDDDRQLQKEWLFISIRIGTSAMIGDEVNLGTVERSASLKGSAGPWRVHINSSPLYIGGCLGGRHIRPPTPQNRLTHFRLPLTCHPLYISTDWMGISSLGNDNERGV